MTKQYPDHEVRPLEDPDEKREKARTPKKPGEVIICQCAAGSRLSITECLERQLANLEASRERSMRCGTISSMLSDTLYCSRNPATSSEVKKILDATSAAPQDATER